MSATNLPYRYEQILRVLAQNPAGLTTPEIMDAAKSMPTNELKNLQVVCRCLFSLRNTSNGLIEQQGNTHKITAKGRGALQNMDRVAP